MRFIFKTDYDQDIKLFQHSGHWWSYGALLALLVALVGFDLNPLTAWLPESLRSTLAGSLPAWSGFGISNYLKSQFVFVFLYAIVGVALLILTGFTGQASLGHAAFLAIGAYTAAYLQQRGVQFQYAFPAAGVLAGITGVLVGYPARRLHGIYLMIATISFAYIVEEVLARWESVTHGNEGMKVKALELFGMPLPRDSNGFYYLTLGLLVLVIWLALNVLRSPTGRAFIALRDSETAAKSMGVDPGSYKVKAFGLSAFITGLAGALYAHKMSFISPEMFTLVLSIEFIMVIVIGGVFGIHGAVFGAIFIVMVDPLLTWLKDTLPASVSAVAGVGAGNALKSLLGASGLKGLIYGLIIMLFVLFEPLGLYGRWLKMKLFFQLFPMYKKATFKRQKTYVKSERNR